MNERADKTIQALRSGHDRLAAQVRDFTAEDLARPSGASAWDISQVVGHLGSNAEIGLAALDRALDGTGRPGDDFNQSVWARWDAMSREERAEGFLITSETLVRRYEGLDGQTRQNLRIDLGFLPAPVDVATAGGLRLSEVAHHTWDVEVAFDPEAALPPEATALLVDQAAMFVAYLGKADALDGRPVAIAVDVTAPDRSFGLEVGETVTLTETPDDPVATLVAPAEWWLRLIGGRHAPEHTPAGVKLTGDAVSLDDLRRVFPGF